MMSPTEPLGRSTKIRTAEIICVGTELLLGDIVNTNAAYLARRLAALGISVYHQTVVGDSSERLTAALNAAFCGAGRPAGDPPVDLVILSGGLGPTYDDLTKETVGAFFGRSTELHEPSLARIRAYFERMERVMTPNNEKQAMMPVGAVVIPNDYGTAPALAVGDDTRTAILLPGPPSELEPIFHERVVPLLLPYTDGVLVSRNVHIMGMGEAAVEEVLRELMVAAENPTVAPYCGMGEVRLRVTAKSHDEKTARTMCDDMIDRIRKTEVGRYMYGVDVENIETALVQVLTEAGLTIGCAESCTGGMIGERLTAVPGASAVFVGGFMTYTNEMKIRMLGISSDTIAAYTEVSAEVAMQMAEGARARLGCDIAVSATGYAGPGGGTEKDPVGTVYCGIATPWGVRCVRLALGSHRTRTYVRASCVSRLLRETLTDVLARRASS